MNISSGSTTYQSGQYLDNQGAFTVGGSASVTLQAGKTITLLQGFHATSGSAAKTLDASIVPSLVPGCIQVSVGISIPSGPVGTYYNLGLPGIYLVVGPGAFNPYTFSGMAPPGLSITSGGNLTGTTTQVGSFNFTVNVTDFYGATGSVVLNLVVNPATQLTITTGSPLPTGTLGAGYSQTLGASGGTAPYSWSVTSGSLPAGTTLSSTGALSGTPTTAGTSSFTVQVLDSASHSATQSYSLTINSNSQNLTITTGSPLPSVTAGTSYSQTLSASGGTTPYSWSVISGSLPAGLTLSSMGTLSGTPTTAATSTFTVQVNDSASHSATQSYSLTINSSSPGVTTKEYIRMGGRVVAIEN
ncbi:MAG: putative Ig domain-containing protein, partial [Limisphaerales bacterium]